MPKVLPETRRVQRLEFISEVQQQPSQRMLLHAVVGHIEDLVQDAAEDVDVRTPDRRFYVFVAYDDHSVVVTIEDILSAVVTVSEQA